LGSGIDECSGERMNDLGASSSRPDLTWKSLLFGFQGRIDRKTFLLRGLLPVLLIYTIRFVMIGDPADWNHPAALKMAIYLTIDILMSWASLALTCKRLHDRDWSGWLQLIVFVGFMLPIMPLAWDLNQTPNFLGPLGVLGMSVIWGIAFVAGIPMLWLSVEALILPGTPGPNQFGSAPMQFRRVVRL
jgi:uncharacterized membrane protein YhaH (DUF805 family)